MEMKNNKAYLDKSELSVLAAIGAMELGNRELARLIIHNKHYVDGKKFISKAEK